MRRTTILTLSLFVLLLAALTTSHLNFSWATLDEDNNQTDPRRKKDQKPAFESSRPSWIIDWDNQKTRQSLKNEPVVLFDQGHSQVFLINRANQLDLSGLARVFHDKGYKAVFTGEKLTEENLSGVNTLVVSGPFKPFSRDEENAIIKWLHKGGNLSLMLHVASPMVGFLDILGISVSNGVIRETANVIESNSLDFAVKDLKVHPITEKINGFNVFGCWALLNLKPTNMVIAQTGSKAWVDLDKDKQLGKKDAVQAFTVAIAGKIGRGAFVVFGDDTLFQNRFLSPENKSLARSMADWLMNLMVLISVNGGRELSR